MTWYTLDILINFLFHIFPHAKLLNLSGNVRVSQIFSLLLNFICKITQEQHNIIERKKLRGFWIYVLPVFVCNRKKYKILKWYISSIYFTVKFTFSNILDL